MIAKWTNLFYFFYYHHHPKSQQKQKLIVKLEFLYVETCNISTCVAFWQFIHFSDTYFLPSFSTPLIFSTCVAFWQFIHFSDTYFLPSFSPPLNCLVKVHRIQTVYSCQFSYSTPKTPQLFTVVSTSAQLIFSKHSF